jgi:ADP-ribosylglycohydrolase/catechol 2,3-dioxygenase-like lactoylglutathione lyase family enzyme
MASPAPTIPDAVRRSEGVMLGAAVGDALGWPQEDRSGRIGGQRGIEPRLDFVAWRRREGGRFQAHEEDIAPGSYSDDTQLILAVARCVLRGDDWWQAWTQRELPFWLLYERGGGGATKRAAASWARGKEPWRDRDPKRYFQAGGNGVAMRVLPHSLFCADASSFDSIAARITADGVATHGHPRALVGALVYGFVLWRALQRTDVLRYGELIAEAAASSEWTGFRLPSDIARDWVGEASAVLGQDYETVWAQTVKEMQRLLEESLGGIERGSLAVDRQTLERLGCFDRQFRGAGTVTTAGAMFLASRYAAQPTQGVLAAAFAHSADTDTLASMAGGILGAVNGSEWLNGLARQLEDAAYVRRLAARLAIRAVEPGDPVDSWRPNTQQRFWKEFERAEVGMRVTLPDGREGEIADTVEHTSRLRTVKARTWVVATADGQTLHLKRVRRVPSVETAADVETAAEVPPRGRLDREPRIGVVLQVTDIERARHFYADVVGLEITKDSPRYIVFGGRLALEAADRNAHAERRDEQAEQLELTQTVSKEPSPTDEELFRHRLAITVYLLPEELEATKERVSDTGLKLTAFAIRASRRAFRCLDPEGHVLEFRERNGT